MKTQLRKPARDRASYTDQYKQEALELWRASGRSAAKVAAELGIRLRYEMSRLVAPYIGVSHERALGRTARIARKAGEVSRSTHVLIGFASAF